jgi:hypothetical protein
MLKQIFHFLNFNKVGARVTELSNHGLHFGNTDHYLTFLWSCTSFKIQQMLILILCISKGGNLSSRLLVCILCRSVQQWLVTVSVKTWTSHINDKS